MRSETGLNTEQGLVVDEELTRFVSWTARLVAVHRHAHEALESEEKDGILKDPLARVFAGPKAFEYIAGIARDAPEKGASIMMSLPAEAPDKTRRIGPGVVRPLFFDYTILASCQAQKNTELAWLPHDLCSDPIRQIVVLGAGLDARPWRLPLPEGVRWYEIDQAEVLRVKQKALQANEAPMKFADNEGARIPVRASQVHQISADLAEAGWPNALQDAGLDGRQLVHWHAEGLLMYLAEQDVRNLLIEASRACKPGSVMTFDTISLETMAQQAKEHMLKNLQESVFKRGFGAANIPQHVQFMKECGWKTVKTVEMDDIASEVLHGFEYNKPERPAGRDCHYFFGIYTSAPSSIGE